MAKYSQAQQQSQVSRVKKCRQHLAVDHDLCFTKLLPESQIETAIEQHHVCFRERLYTPLVTIWTFLYQVLAPDQSCRAAVARLLAYLCVGGRDTGSPKTDPYCKARQRLPEELVADLARRSGQDLQRQVPSTKLLGGRPIKMADGTTLSMPDTPANQKTYPQQSGQKKGLGFPIIRPPGPSCGRVSETP